MGVASRRRREREERRAAILDAAARVFQQKGLTAATMDEVAAEAELSKGTLYLYFKNKDDLFVALSSRVVDRVVERFAAAVADRSRSGIDCVADMLHGYAEIAAANPHQFRLVIAWLATGEAVDTTTEAFLEHRQRIEAVVGHLTGAITRGQTDGSVSRERAPLLLAGQLWAGMLGALMFHINSDELVRRFPQPVDMSSFTTSFVGILVDGIRPREDAP